MFLAIQHVLLKGSDRTIRRLSP